MAQSRYLPKGVNPKLTEEFLLGIAEVTDASVWWHEGDLRACVTVIDQSGLNGPYLQTCCQEELGVHQTPKAITLMQARGRAA